MFDGDHHVFATRDHSVSWKLASLFAPLLVWHDRSVQPKSCSLATLPLRTIGNTDSQRLIAKELNECLCGIVINTSTCLRMLSADPPNVERAHETARRTICCSNRAAEAVSHLR